MSPEEKKTILVIEDEESLQDAIRIKLEAAGFNVLSSITAEDGLKVLSNTKPDLIWLDLLLPGMGGFNFLEHIRMDADLKNLPVAVVSVSASPEKIKAAFELNIVDYIVKSQYKLEDIVGKIKNIIYESK